MKQQLEAAIEGKHSKLTKVYKALETECQNELKTCRGKELNSTAVAAAAEAAAAADLNPNPNQATRVGSGMRLAGVYSRLMRVVSTRRATQSCTDPRSGAEPCAALWEGRARSNARGAPVGSGPRRRGAVPADPGVLWC